MAQPAFIGGPLGQRAKAQTAGLDDLGIPEPSAPPVESEEDEAKKADAKRDALQWVLECVQESRTSRESGHNPRRDQWERNYDDYWGRTNTTGKQSWQADERLPTVADHVERFTAAMREALGAAGDNFYRFEDRAGKSGRLESLSKRILDAALAHCSQNVTGQHVGFPSVFAKAVKAGAMTRFAMSVTWQNGRLRIENVDSRELFHDPTGSGLYRIRERHIDLHRIQSLKSLRRSDGTPLYDAEAIDRIVGGLGASEERVVEKERATGIGQQTDSTRRRPVEIHEFLGTLLSRDGSVVAENQLVVVAERREVIRGPEVNPFWHKMDWIVCTPLIEVPFSIDGRSYVESFGHLAALFQEFTNLLLDGVRLEIMPSYEIYPEKLERPDQAKDGIWPGKMFLADQDAMPGESFVRKIDTGSVPPGAFTTWEAIKQLVRESSSQNELRLGRLADKSGITATEIDAAEGGSNVLVKHIAEGIEENGLAPVLDLAWWTTLQHLDPQSDPELLAEIGDESANMIFERREELRKQTFRLRARGITGILALSQERRAILSALQVIGQNDLLAQQFLQDYSLPRTLDQLFRSMRLPIEDLRKTEEERAAVASGSQVPPGMAPGNVPRDGTPQLPVNQARASALRLPRGASEEDAAAALPVGR